MPLDPLTIIAAIVAILVIWKLRSVLGARTGYERPPRNPFVDTTKERNRQQAPPQNTPPMQGGALPPAAEGTVRLPGGVPAADTNRWHGYAEQGSPVASGLDAIAAADPGFAPGPFLEGAKVAYETVLKAFAGGDRKSLQSLLAKDVYASFATALDERAKRGDTMSTTFVSLDAAKIEAAEMQDRLARVGVRFVSTQISATHDAQGQLVDGSPERPVEINDLWTFARDVGSRDPNWRLVATQSGA